MAAIDIRPYRETVSSGAGTSTVTHSYKVSVDGSGSANKRWLIDRIEVEFGTQASNNTVDVQFDVGDAGSPANILPQFADFTYLPIHMSSYFGRPMEMEEDDDLEIVFTRGTSSTADSVVYLIERDI